MKKGILSLLVLGLMTSCVLAGPHGPKNHHQGGHKKPKVHMNYHSPRYHHNHFYRGYYPCACYDPYCIHRRHMRGHFHIMPGFSINVSI